MEYIRLDVSKVYGFVNKNEIESAAEKVQKANKALEEKTGKGNDFLGWVNLPSSITEEHLKDIEATAQKIRKEIDVLVVVGIGGSYLGAKAVSEAMTGAFTAYAGSSDKPAVLFAGQNIGEDYLTELMQLLDTKRYAIVVISKSGTTTEPAIAFRILKNHLESKVGEEKAKDLIVAVTDEKKGALRTLANQNDYKTYVIPDDVGGRYSVLTPVGLVPLAIGGFDIRALVNGARDMETKCSSEVSFNDNPAAIYAATRIALYNSGKKIEILANYENKLHYVAEWWKQLFGESDGKDGLGIYPSSVDLTADLHSMGQYIQEGERTLMETVISIAKPDYSLTIPSDKDNLDGLNFLAGKNLDYVNKMAELGTQLAHVDGGVPNIRIELPRLTEYYLGQLMYFFEKACGIGGYLMDINPFNQPGVEAYKKNMFALLEKPGFEEESKKIKERI
ncbi:MAG: glucose-6-phosphate isomerase [Bacteroidales bacterium]|nr:glucose-6-phosphate isomerase [Bacteroidales bacterium]MBN2819243.1 glucose-6-phosphate isomerase [Bacteroidales bacterium]